MNLTGSIDLLRLEKACVATLKGVRCVVIPVDMNDIYVSADKETLEARGAFLGFNVYERREPSERGETHYIKQSFSKNFREGKSNEYEERKKVYIGGAKPNEYQQVQAQAPAVMVDNDSDLPF